MKILFFGSDSFAIPSLARLCTSRHTLAGVVTQPDKPAGRGRKMSPCPVAIVAKERKFPLHQPADLKDPRTIESLKNLGADLLAVVAYGRFIPDALVKAHRHRAVNVHPSLLPRYRGAAPIQWALLNGDTKTGVTTMAVVPEMDAGDIYLQCETTVGAEETAADLQQRLGQIGAELLLETVNLLEEGVLRGKPQDPAGVVLAPKLSKESGRLDWSRSAVELHNRVRALQPWPGCHTFLEGKRINIWKSAPLPDRFPDPPGTVLNREGELIVVCGEGALLLKELQLEGKKRLPAEEFLKGHPIPGGTLL